jgi:hypothetical protein
MAIDGPDSATGEPDGNARRKTAAAISAAAAGHSCANMPIDFAVTRADWP